MHHKEIIEDIRLKIGLRKRIIIKDNKLILSAVLLPLLYKDDELCILFTKRSYYVEYHKGEISFPGGTLDSGDKDFRSCVLRETMEEIGVSASSVDILGTLDDLRTVASPFIITPIVGFISPPYSFNINAREVDRIILISIDKLLHKSVYKEKYAQNRNISYFHYDSDVIWGATGIILKCFLSEFFGFSPSL